MARSGFAFQLLEIFKALGLEKLVDATQVLTHFPAAELVDFRDKAVEKIAVVAHHDEGAVEILKCLLEHVFRAQIEVVGGLVEDEKIEGFEQEFEDGQSRALTAGQYLHLFRSYFAQNQASLLDGEVTVYDTIDSVAKGEIRLKIRDLLGAFMFGGEEGTKKVKVLSRSRILRRISPFATLSMVS